MWKKLPIYIILSVLVLCPSVHAKHLYFGKADWAGSRRTLHITPSEAEAVAVYDNQSTITANGTKVTQWNDRSGNELHLSQSGSGNEPTLTTIGGRRALQHGPGLYFKNASTNASFATASAKSVIYVVQPAAITGHQLIFDFNGGYWSSAINYYGSGNKYFIANADGSTDLSAGIVATTNTTVVSGMHSGGALYEWVNGVSAGAGVASGNTSDMTRTPLSVGASSTGTFFYTGKTAAIAFFNKALPDSTRVSIEQYERRYWGF